MKHNLKISISKRPQTDSIIACRCISVREKFLRLLFSKKKKLTILVPGDNVEEIVICEAKQGDETI